MSDQLQNYTCGTWVAGSGKQSELVDASTGELIATTSSGGLDFAAMLKYGREVGGPPLRKMTFPERGRMLKALALYLMDRKEEFYGISYRTGATKADSWVDIEGGIGNVFANASLRKQLGNMPFYVDGPPVMTSREMTTTAGPSIRASGTERTVTRCNFFTSSCAQTSARSKRRHICTSR